MATLIENASANTAALAENTYPGRGIVIGKNAPGDKYVQIYWIMGRSENSRNRIFVRSGDEVKTEAYDSSKVVDSSLIIYTAMTRVNNVHIVTNGNQTDDIEECVKSMSSRNLYTESFENALIFKKHEPDSPNFTPRISAMLDAGNNTFVMSQISRTSQDIDSEDSSEHAFYYYGYGHNPPLLNGLGRCIHTYDGDGDPLPPFSKRPYPILLGETIDEITQSYWHTLNPENRVSLVVKTIDVNHLDDIQYRIKNHHDISKQPKILTGV